MYDSRLAWRGARIYTTNSWQYVSKLKIILNKIFKLKKCIFTFAWWPVLHLAVFAHKNELDHNR